MEVDRHEEEEELAATEQSISAQVTSLVLTHATLSSVQREDSMPFFPDKVAASFLLFIHTHDLLKTLV